LNRKNNINAQNIFLVLVPHRDTRLELQKYNGALFKAGLADVYTFPCAVPLTSLSRPLNADELKNTARRLREAASAEKFHITGTSTCRLSVNDEDMILFGPKIEYDSAGVNSIKIEKIKSLISPLIAAACLIPNKNGQKVLSALKLKTLANLASPELTFRAAAIANMFWKPVRKNGETFYKWKIDKLIWLPKMIT